MITYTDQLTLSTDFPDEPGDPSDKWISQAEAARIRGVSRQAINKLVQAVRLGCVRVGGHILVNRDDVERFRQEPSGRPARGDSKAFQRIKGLLETCDAATRMRVLEWLRAFLQPPHPVELKLGVTTDLILDALNLSSELTQRMFKRVVAEAAFSRHVIGGLADWRNEPVVGHPAYDFTLADSIGPVRVQVKLQRSERGTPVIRNGYYDVETHRTREGRRKGEKTRPYHFGEFDILAVCMKPSRGQWDSFLYTLGSWLQPHRTIAGAMATHQPIPALPNADWTDDFRECARRLRAGESRTIAGQLTKLRGKDP